MAEREVVVESVQLTKVFRDFWRRQKVRAIDNLNLQIRRGEVFGLLGPNGSGKSTAIKIMLGLLFPTSGSVAIFGRHPRNLAIKERIGYLPEESYLYRYLNARETLDFYGRLFNLHRADRARRIDALLEMVGLERQRHRPLSEYSKGMARRIGLAQALINDPELLLLDEPTTGLDPIGTRQIKDLIRELKARGKTVLLCSHLLADVEDICDRIGILYGGKLWRLGTVGELLARKMQTQLTASTLAPATIAKIKALVAAEEPDKEIQVETPMDRLEDFFLRVVDEARQARLETAGVTEGTGVADFLTRGAEEPAPAGEALLAELAQAPAAASPEEAPEPLPAGPRPQEPDVGLLGRLTSAPAAEEQAPDETEPKPAAPRKEERRAEDVLRSLTESPDHADASEADQQTEKEDSNRA